MVVPDQGVETGVLVVVDVNAAARKGYLKALQGCRPFNELQPLRTLS